MRAGEDKGEASVRFGAGIWLFGQFVDRYATDAYGPEVSTLEAIDAAGSVGDIEVLDINYPFTEGVSVEDVRTAERDREDRALATRLDLGHRQDFRRSTELWAALLAWPNGAHVHLVAAQ